MKRKSWINSLVCFALIISLLLAATQTVYAEKTYDQYKVSTVMAGEEGIAPISVLKIDGSAYLTAEDAARLSKMEYSKNDSNDCVFTKEQHQVIYSGQTKDLNGVTYVRMQDAMDQLSCQYTYSSSLEAIVFDPTENFIENLLLDCSTVFNRCALPRIDEIPFAEATVRLYGFVSSGWNPKYAWGGDRCEHYEDTLWGIMMPSENESALLSIAEDGNKAAKTVSNILKFSDEVLSLDIAELETLVPSDFMSTYTMLNEAIPGMDVSDYLGLLEKAYSSQYASTLYANAVKYGLSKNRAIDDIQLSAAVQKASKYFEDETLLVQSFIEDWAINYAEKGFEELGKAALKETLENTVSYSSISVKMAKLFSDEVLGMKKTAGAVLTLLDCAEIQKEARSQYEKNCTRLNSKEAILAMKYSALLYVRACEYGYEKYKSSGSAGEACYEMMQPITSSFIEQLASYSDHELTRAVKNENPNFSLKGFTLVGSEDDADVNAPAIVEEETESISDSDNEEYPFIGEVIYNSEVYETELDEVLGDEYGWEFFCYGVRFKEPVHTAVDTPDGIKEVEITEAAVWGDVVSDSLVGKELYLKGEFCWNPRQERWEGPKYEWSDSEQSEIPYYTFNPNGPYAFVLEGYKEP